MTLNITKGVPVGDGWQFGIGVGDVQPSAVSYQLVNTTTGLQIKPKADS